MQNKPESTEAFGSDEHLFNALVNHSSRAFDFVSLFDF